MYIYQKNLMCENNIILHTYILKHNKSHQLIKIVLETL